MAAGGGHANGQETRPRCERSARRSQGAAPTAPKSQTSTLCDPRAYSIPTGPWLQRRAGPSSWSRGLRSPPSSGASPCYPPAWLATETLPGCACPTPVPSRCPALVRKGRRCRKEGGRQAGRRERTSSGGYQVETLEEGSGSVFAEELLLVKAVVVLQSTRGCGAQFAPLLATRDNGGDALRYRADAVKAQAHHRVSVSPAWSYRSRRTCLRRVIRAQVSPSTKRSAIRPLLRRHQQQSGGKLCGGG